METGWLSLDRIPQLDGRIQYAQMYEPESPGPVRLRACVLLLPGKTLLPLSLENWNPVAV